jgi:hypothetical protein
LHPPPNDTDFDYDSAMPRYIVVHHAPGVSPEDFQKSVPAVLEGKFARFVQCYANMADGLIINIYDGDSEQSVARELERIGFPFDEIKEQQFAASHADLTKMAGG